MLLKISCLTIIYYNLASHIQNVGNKNDNNTYLPALASSEPIMIKLPGIYRMFYRVQISLYVIFSTVVQSPNLRHVNIAERIIFLAD